LYRVKNLHKCNYIIKTGIKKIEEYATSNQMLH
jgi:hypothetical protein